VPFCRYGVIVILMLAAACGTRVPATTALPELGPAETPVAADDSSSASKTHNAPIHEERAAPTPTAKAFPESMLGAPESDLAALGLKNNTVLSARTSGVPAFEAWQLRKNSKDQIVGFEFSNPGGNRILPERYDIGRNLLFTRDFQFHFDDRARQDIHLAITDWAPAPDRQFRLSDLMNSVILFFPRTYLPAITNAGDRTIVTLPTGETVEFDAVTREILGGALSEDPVDLSTSRAARTFPRIFYNGGGVIVRANARGADPRIATSATILNGSAAECSAGAGPCQCQVPARELWQQSGAVRFKFPADAEFDRYLRSRCGFGLPLLGSPSS
jgi:hypothetical protein